jgi:Flp pilus assembly protein TadG
MRQRLASRRRRDENGASAVEFALIMPIFIVLVFGIIAFGIVFAQNLALGNSARQAARFAVVQERTCGEIRTEARDSATGTIAMNTANIGVTVERIVSGGGATTLCGGAGSDANKPCEGAAEGSSIKVETTYQSKVIIPLVVSDNNVTINGEGIFRCEFR